jgi:hypothetical protein
MIDRLVHHAEVLNTDAPRPNGVSLASLMASSVVSTT